MAASENPKEALEDEDSFVFVYDRREKGAPEVKISTGGLFSFADFKERVQEALGISRNAKFVIATTNREEIKDDNSWDIIDKGDTLYVLRSINQELCAPAEERVNYLPHYDTIVKGGMYEYYASEGQNPLPYAFAELIDNSLAATRSNAGPRNIEIRLHLEESAIYVIDNGKGMTPRQLNNWAIYRLSKFIRKDRRSKVNLDETVEEEMSFVDRDLPKSLNSDISYFGVGGKQAIFFIGTSTRMISRAEGSQDIHELTISKEEFEKKEKNHESIYSGYIRNRKTGDASHVSTEDEVLRNLIEKEEKERGSFTVVVIHGICKEHLVYLKERVKEWTRQLAHIYHYYLHGPSGNVAPDEDSDHRAPSPFKNIDIQVKVWQSRSQTVPRLYCLRDVEDDMQSLFVRGTASSFEFKALIEGATVEGVLRYHPFLYDRETYPTDVYDKETTFEDEHDYALSDIPARGRKSIFECFWNGRLIPYTQIDSFDWCAPPKKAKNLPSEVYNRVSGVLWTDDNFQVSTNKLTFIDLELKLRDKMAGFAKVLNGQEKRTSIEKEFTAWLKECHELHDKQIHFSQFQGQVVRTDLPKNKQTPWAAYKQVEWDGKAYKAGQLVRILRTSPALLGSINRILLYGEHDGEVFATGGDLEIHQEPRSMYNDVKVVPLTKLDRTASNGLVKRYIEEEEAKLPSDLEVSWPEGNAVQNNEKRRAGKTVGDIKVEIMNRKGDKISNLPGKDLANKKLLVELRVIWHENGGDVVLVNHISQHGKTWPYWFRKMENIKNLGQYTLQIQVVLNESGENMFAGKQLPCRKINFTVTEAEPETFTVGLLEGPFRVGVPFNIPLDLQDGFGNPAKAAGISLTPTLEANSLEISYAVIQVRGHSIMLKDVVAKGQLSGIAGKNFNLTIKIKELQESTKTMKIRLLPGPASCLSVQPEGEYILQNGQSPVFKVQLQDVAGNVTALDQRQSVVCKFHGASGLPSYSTECSSLGAGSLTGDIILLKKMKNECILTAKIDVQGTKLIKTVERKIKLVPSGRVCEIKLFYKQGDMKESKQIVSSQELVKPAGEFLEGLTFKLFDEAEREIKLDDKIVSKIKVNWQAKLPKDIALKGQLPNIKATTTLADSKYCQVSVQDNSSIDCGFVLKTIANKASQIKCTCVGKNEILIGQPMAASIQVTVKDKFDNEITHTSDKVVNDLKITGEGLKPERCKVTIEKNLKAMSISGVVFEGGTLGRKELQVQWGVLKDYVRLEMVAGPPSQIKVIDFDPEQEIVVYNENKMSRPFNIQLLDAGDNPSMVADIRVQLAKDPKLKIIPSPQPVRTNKDGIAQFGVFTISSPRGVYEIQPKAFISAGFVISGPKFRVSVEPDPDRPSNLEVKYNNKAIFVAGESMADFTVKVFAEDESLMGSAKSSHVSMKLWKSEGPDQDDLPNRTLSYSPESTRKPEAGIFNFKNLKVPEEAGSYNIMFVYYDGKHQLFSNVIHIKIEAAIPICLVPEEHPGTATVSNTRAFNTRLIVRHLKLELKDKYENTVRRMMNGAINITIDSPTGEAEFPTFVGGLKSTSFALAGGTCVIANLALQENSPGSDGCEYQLQCTVQCTSIPKGSKLKPYTIPFLFYNDAKKQSEMASLSKERDNLQNAIRTYKSLFETTEQLIEELKISVKEAKTEENKIRDELRRQKVNMSQTNSVDAIENLVKSLNDSKETVLNSHKKKRHCALQTILPNDPDVLGKIGHLALISDDDAARVLSWHMSSDMDCVVTMTTKKAKEIYSQTNGRQQVLPLDSIFKKSLTDWNKPLPHMKYKPNWRPAGNLMYARQLLTFSQNSDKCQTVFSMLLGDTLWIDTLDQANDYRRELVKFTNCPTILTREGDRIRSNGKFGGLMNKALPFEKLRGAVFGAPVPDTYKNYALSIDTLQNLKSAIMAHQTAKEELNEQMETINAPEMQTKYEECREVEKQLREVEKNLGVGSPATPNQRNPRDPRLNPREPIRTPDRVDEGPANKRLRSSPAVSGAPPESTPVPSVNGTNGTSSPASNLNTPTRQSRRIASMTPTTDHTDKKKLKKS